MSVFGAAGKSRVGLKLFFLALACLIFVLVVAASVVAEEFEGAEPGEPAQTPPKAPTWLKNAMVAPPGASARAKASNERDLSTPAEREASRTAFRGLDHGAAAAVAAQEFPALVTKSIDPAPKLRQGERITGYPTPNTARLELLDGKNAVVDSLLPLVTRTAEGDQVPVDLAVREGDEAFVPNHPIVPVRFPEQISEGLELPSLGLTLIPSDQSGTPLDGEGAISGAVAHYANTQTDTDTIVKPVPLGFQTHSILRSPASPEQLHFSVEIENVDDPGLIRLEDGSVLIEADGKPITAIPPVSAVDAAGEPVPASIDISGDLLVVTAEHRSAEFMYPIDVDPTAVDFDDFTESEGQHNWVYDTNAASVYEPESVFGWGGSLRVDNGEYPYNRNAYQYGNFASWFYLTQGVSRIYEFEADGGQTWDWGSYWESTADAFISIVGSSGAEGTTWEPPATVCANGSCSPAGGSAGNAALFELIATQNADNYIGASLEAAYVKIAQDQAATITFNTTDPEVGGKPNALYQGGKWLKASDEARVAFSATDPGLGLSFASLASPGFSQWSGEIYQSLTGCVGVQCDPSYSVNRPVGNLPDGKRSIAAYVSNAAIDNELTTHVKVDNAAPTAQISGLGVDHITDLGAGEITVEVTDGTGSTESSGVKAGETAVLLDGEEILAPGGEGCSPGPCTISRDYDFIGRDLGIGVHTLTVEAVDQVGNEESTEIPFIVQSSGPAVDMGPGRLNIKNGNLLLSSTDVSETVPGSSLTVTRTHESLRSLSEPSPFGPGWQLDFGAWRGATKVAAEDVVLTDAKGRQVIFEKNGAKYTPPPQYYGWKLSYNAEYNQLNLEGPDGGTTSFKHLSGAPETQYTPYVVKDPDGEAILFQGASYSSGTVKPSLLGTESCVLPELLEPCKWLYFYYDSSTTATGSAPDEWGDYAGRLSKVKMLAWSTEGGFGSGNEELHEVTVAEYSYDANGRLRAVWDPRVSPHLKTTYGYDAAGHVTAITPPGQQPWLMRYGSKAGSPYSDWLLSASHPPAAAELVDGKEPENVEAPFLSSTNPIAKTTYSVWNGTWENNPLSYSYQWYRCDSTGEDCTLINGATHQSYTPNLGDVGYRLMASVAAANATGSASATTAPSAVVISGGTYVSSFGAEGSGGGQFNYPIGVARDSQGDIWVADTNNDRVQRFSEEGEVLSQFGGYGTGNGQFRSPSDLAIDSKDRIWVVDGYNERIQRFTIQGEYLGEVEINLEEGGAVGLATDSSDNLWVANSNTLELEQFDENGEFIQSIKPEQVPWVVPIDIAVGPSGSLWVADTNAERIIEFNQEGDELTSFGSYGTGNGQFKHPAAIEVDALGDIWVADGGNDRVQKFDASGEYIAQFGSYGSSAGQFKLGYQVGLSVGSEGNVWVADAGNDRVQKWLSPAVVSSSSFGVNGSEPGQLNVPSDLTTTADGHVWVADTFNQRIQEFNAAGEYVGHFGEAGGGEGQLNLPVGITVDGEGDIWTANFWNHHIQEFNTEGELLTQFGEVGSEPGQLKNPTRIAVDSEGNLWIADSGNHRIQKFSPEGELLGGFGEEGSEPGQFQFPVGISIDSLGNLWVADRDNHRVQEFSPEGEFLVEVGEEGSGPGQFKFPYGIASDPRGNIWVADKNNHRIQIFAPNGTYLTKFGEEGNGEGQFKTPSGIDFGADGRAWIADRDNHRVSQWQQIMPGQGAPPPNPAAGVVIPSTSFGSKGAEPGQFNQPYDLATATDGDVWVADSFNHRLQRFSPSGEFLSQFGESGSEEGQLNLPVGVTVDPEGDLWTSNFFNHHVQEFSPEGELLTEFGEVGSEPGQLKNPARIAVDSAGDVWVADSGNDRVQRFSAEGEFIDQFGEEGSGDGQLQFPAGIVIDSEGNIWVADRDNHRVQKFSPEGEFLGKLGEEGSEPGQLKVPTGIAIGSEGNIWIADANNDRVQRFDAEGGYLGQFGEEGAGEGQLQGPGGIAFGSGGRIWVADRGNNRISQWQHVIPGQGAPPPNPQTATWTAVYDVSVSGSGAPKDMSASGVSKWAQGTAPVEAAAIFPPDQVPGSAPTDYKRATVYYMDEADRIINTLAPGGRISTEEHDQFGNVARTLTPENRQRALDAGWQSETVSEQLDTRLNYSEGGTKLLNVLGPKREVELESGEEVEARPSTKYFYDEGAPELGGPYGLVTKTTEGALVGESEHDVRTKTFGYDGQEGLGWELGEPTSETVDPGGLNLTSKILYDADSGNVIETRMPAGPEGGDAHSMQTTYYTSGESEVEGCGGRPELEGLVCQTRPAAQPETPGLPDLPVTSSEYNIYGQPTLSTEVVGESVRTATIEYDEAGRPLSTQISSTDGKALPKVQMLYDEGTGLPTVQATETESIVSEYDSLGQLTAYTDADGSTSTFAYDVLGRPTEVSDGKGTQTFSYDATTGDLTGVDDSAAGAFGAEYDAGGKMTSQVLPNGLEARYTYDSGGAATALEYVDTTACSEECTLFEQEAMPSIHGETLSESSTRGALDYAYDAAGRLVEAQETPQGEGCTTRLYSYDADTNRTAATTRGPAEGGSCAQSGGETQTNAFDEADRLLGEGIEYDSFGNITTLPGEQAGGKALTSAYYADDSAASISQDGTTIEYMLDPTGREREAITDDGEAESSVVSHFSGGGDSPAWTEDGSGDWTRYVGGMGGLAAIQSSTGGIEMQIADLGGDIIATAPAEEAEELDFIGDATEYGVPKGEGAPGKYSWLGSAQRPTELESGVVNMGARTYVPEIGRFLQTDPVAGGSANAYAYVHGDPVGESDLSGEYTPGTAAPPWLREVMEEPPGMPPPPPPPAVESELLEELIWHGVAGSAGGGAHMSGIGDVVDSVTGVVGGYIGPILKVLGKGAKYVARAAGWIASKLGRAASTTFKVAVRFAVNAANGGRRTAKSVARWVKRNYDTHRPELIQCGQAAFSEFAQYPAVDWKPRVVLAAKACRDAVREWRNR